MCELKGLRITGIVMASLATMVAMGSEGFYIWKAVEVSECTSNSTTIIEYEPCRDERNESAVCFHEELQLRSYVGLGEGIVGIIAGICFIIGFVRLVVPILWVWIIWAMGITAYNGYCIYDYFTTIDRDTTDCFPESEFWDVFTEQDYSHFFIMVTTSVCGYGLVLCVVIPIAAIITNMVRGT